MSLLSWMKVCLNDRRKFLIDNRGVKRLKNFFLKVWKWLLFGCQQSWLVAISIDFVIGVYVDVCCTIRGVLGNSIISGIFNGIVGYGVNFHRAIILLGWETVNCRASAIVNTLLTEAINWPLHINISCLFPTFPPILYCLLFSLITHPFPLLHISPRYQQRRHPPDLPTHHMINSFKLWWCIAHIGLLMQRLFLVDRFEVVGGSVERRRKRYKRGRVGRLGDWGRFCVESGKGRRVSYGRSLRCCWVVHPVVQCDWDLGL